MSGTDIKKRLQFISDKMVAATNQSVLLGKSAISQTSTTNLFVPQLINYTNFSTSWVKTTISGADSIMDTIYIAESQDTTWSSMKSALTGNTNTDGTKYKKKSFECNFTNALKSGGGLYKSGNVELYTLASADSGSKTSFTGLLHLLNTLRVSYNFLEDSNFKKYKANDSSLVVNKYEIVSLDSNNLPVYDTVSRTDAITIVSTIIPDLVKLDHSSSNILAIRRVLLGYELMIHCYLSIKLLDLYVGGSGQSDPVRIINNKLKVFVEATISKIIALNDSSYDENSGIGTLQSKLDERISTYNNYRQNIDTVDKKVSDAKLNISVQHNLVQSNAKFLKTNQTIYYVFMSLFIIGLLLLGVSQQKSSNPSNQTKFIVSVIFSVSIVSLVVMFMVNKYLLREAFASLPNSTLDTALSTNTGNLQMLYQDTALTAFNDYLTNTIYVSLLMGTYRRYGDITHALQKEFTYYDNLIIQLNQSTDKLEGNQTYDYRMSKVLQYRVYLFLQLLSILAFVVLINLYTGTSNSLMVIGVFVALFFVYLYMVNVNNLVRTDARKLYWETPSSTLLN